MSDQNQNFFKSQVLGHPSGLFVLFFTEMWERFSFYGMRVLLINFLTMSIIGVNPGWEWTSENAGALFGTYAGLLYLTPIVGGILADKVMGYRKAVFLGALVMTLGHASMAFETELSLYLGLALLVIGTGLFKPNMTSIVSEMYKDLPEKKDGAYTIFYMGVNAGAFFGMMLCGYLAEKIGWSWGFGLAGIFMLLGMIQFMWAKPLFGKIGEKPEKTDESENEEEEDLAPEMRYKNPFTMMDKILTFITATIGLLYLLNDPSSKIGGFNLLPEEFIISKDVIPGPIVLVSLALILFLYLVLSRILRYGIVVRNRMFAVIIFAIFTIFFWMSFEQGATSLVLFARDFTDRILDGTAATIYIVVDSILTIVPLAIISWVLIKLFKETRDRIASSNMVLAVSFVIVWGIAIWKIVRDVNSDTYNVEYAAIEVVGNKTEKKLDKEVVKQSNVKLEITESTVDFGKLYSSIHAFDETKVNGKGISYKAVVVKDSSSINLYSEKEEEKSFNDEAWNDLKLSLADASTHYYAEVSKDTIDKTVLVSFIQSDGARPDSLNSSDNKVYLSSITTNGEVIVNDPLEDGSELNFISEGGKFVYLDADKEAKIRGQLEANPDRESTIFKAKLAGLKSGSVEITASWFSILNSFFIIAFASIFSKWWESKYNPSAAYKYGYGLIIMAIGFGLLAFGAMDIPQGADPDLVKVSMVWLILAYLFHTLGELCLSPVGLSYLSKLVPPKMIAFMFGMWYLAIAIGNKLAATVGGMVEDIQAEYSMSVFFLIFTIIPAAAGVIVILLNKPLKRLMGGVN